MRYRAFRRKTEAKSKNKLKKIAEEKNYCIGGVYLHNGHYVIYDRGKRSKWLKRQSNKKLRREKDIFQRGQYRKVFDYWWELW